MKYNPKKIEPKWQKIWEERKAFRTEEQTDKPKYYALDMFPYPSGAGLHVGHVVGYTATDIIARYKRQKGYNVLHPMGWDSFGLPAEQYAVKTGTHPEETTKKNINTYRRQLKSLGFSYDWDREIATSDPSYYKWTQWIFTKLYERGLAYEAEMFVNYCPHLGTVLANEEVENGRAKEGGYPVIRKPLKQWVLKICAYADRLLSDLDLLDWPEGLKKLQKNWIGRSQGANVFFPLEEVDQQIEVFTTRPDTLFGVSALVLSPEHPLIEKITASTQRREVEEYRKEAAGKSDLERAELNKEKTGVFTGSYAINPATEEKIPIWIADYVLINYGTGAVMSVPAHDERDFAFAKKYNLPICPVIDPGLHVDEEFLEENESAQSFRERVLRGEACFSGYGEAIHCDNGEISLNGLPSSEAIDTITTWLDKTETGAYAVSYKLRDWLFSRQRYWGEPFPILHFEDGSKRILDLDELPLCPPAVEDYKPSGDGKSPLAKVTSWIEIVDEKTGKKAMRESNTMPQWAGSCWYYLRFIDPQNEMEAWDKQKERHFMPVDLYVGGAEHATLHLLYARFWHKVLFDCDLVSTPEPFQTLRNQGMVVSRSFKDERGVYYDKEEVEQKDGEWVLKKTGEKLLSQIEKMSKSKLNGVTPDAIVEEFGADSLRLYEMFMGPLEKEKVWNTDAVSGCYRFLNRFYEMATSDRVSNESSEEGRRLAHRLLHKVTADIEALQFNTAIAKLMEFLNDFTKLEIYPRSSLKIAIQCLHPFAPHIAEELWEHLAFEEELSCSLFPEPDPSLLSDEMVTYVVQVNGKVRGRFDLPKDETKESILKLAKQDKTVAKYLDGQEVKRVIFIPNKLLNLVVF